MSSFILKMSNNRKKRTEKERSACEEMEANRRRELGAGEVRRLHIVYFLSRSGKIEQPHLIRVHHSSNNGVHLRDVKRWLSELRGREMPESFSWSYKRSYRSGHIWQDLTDDDLITPFSDNEYVLKGSLLPSPHNKAVEHLFPFEERRKQDKEEEEDEEEEPIPKTPDHETFQIEANVSPKPPPRGDEESSPIRPSSEETIRNRAVVNTKNRAEMREGDKEKSCSEVVLKKSGSQVLNKSNSKGRGEARPRRRRAADVIRNILRCRLVDTKDSVKKESRGQNGSISRKSYQTSNGSNARKSWEKKGSNGGSRKLTEKTTPAMHKPSKEPNCSQCGKPFKPEKLHSHMKSCMALKERGRSSSFNKEEKAAVTRRPSKVTVTVL